MMESGQAQIQEMYVCFYPIPINIITSKFQNINEYNS
jgi:hypothetical protein